MIFGESLTNLGTKQIGSLANQSTHWSGCEHVTRQPDPGADGDQRQCEQNDD